MRRPLAVLLCCAAGLLPAWSQAQKMYRCGSVYQDRPCHGVDSKVVGRAAAPGSQADAPVPIDPACDAAGMAAQKLMWEKESGRTLDEQLAKPGVNADLVKNVYARRGSSLQVRKAIEVECVQNLEKERASGQARDGRAKALPPVAQEPAAAQKGGAEFTDVAAWQAAQKQKASACADLRADLNRLQRAQREGGDVTVMDGLRDQVREVLSRQRAKGC